MTKEKTNTKSSATQYSKTFKYICITCLTQCDALYKQYSSENNIKLQSCAFCGSDVDPYIERELLLVVIDMVLMRPKAYRHFFFNRTHALATKIDNNEISFNFYSSKNAIVLLLICIAFRAMLNTKNDIEFKDEMLDTSVIHDMNIILVGIFIPFLYQSTIEMISLCLGSILSAIYILSTRNKKGIIDNSNKKLFMSQMFAAMVMPQLFHLVTLFVHIYEDSLTVRLLGIAFVKCFTFMSAFIVMESWTFFLNENASSSKVKKNISDCRGHDANHLSQILTSCLPVAIGFLAEFIISSKSEIESL